MSEMKTVEQIVAESLEAIEKGGRKATRSRSAARAFLRRIGVEPAPRRTPRTHKVKP